MSKKNNDKPTNTDDAFAAAKSIFTTIATAAAKKVSPTTVAEAPSKGAVDTAIELMKSNKGLLTAAATQVLTRHPLGRIAGMVLATEQGQKLAGQAFDKATDIAGGALKTVTDRLASPAPVAKKDKDEGPKAP